MPDLSLCAFEWELRTGRSEVPPVPGGFHVRPRAENAPGSDIIAVEGVARDPRRTALSALHRAGRSPALPRLDERRGADVDAGAALPDVARAGGGLGRARHARAGPFRAPAGDLPCARATATSATAGSSRSTATTGRRRSASSSARWTAAARGSARRRCARCAATRSSEMSLHKIRLDVYANNPSAIKTYERVGFRKEGRPPRGGVSQGSAFRRDPHGSLARGAAAAQAPEALIGFDVESSRARPPLLLRRGGFRSPFFWDFPFFRPPLPPGSSPGGGGGGGGGAWGVSLRGGGGGGGGAVRAGGPSRGAAAAPPPLPSPPPPPYPVGGGGEERAAPPWAPPAAPPPPPGKAGSRPPPPGRTRRCPVLLGGVALGAGAFGVLRGGCAPGGRPRAGGVRGGGRRGIGRFDATCLVVGSMIGSGIFIVSAESARLLGSPGWLLLAWGIAGVLTLAAALSCAELAAMLPRAGGQYVFFREAYGPLAGFLFGWAMFLVIQTGTIAAVAVAFAKFLGVLVPAVSSRPLFTAGRVAVTPVQLVAAGVVVLLTASNATGLKTGTRTQNLFTTAKFAALLALAVSGLLPRRRPGQSPSARALLGAFARRPRALRAIPSPVGPSPWPSRRRWWDRSSRSRPGTT